MNAKELGAQQVGVIPYPTGEWPPEEAIRIMKHCAGLIKREIAAFMAMQGILAMPARDDGLSFGEMACDAVRCADALLAALAKEQP